MMNRKESGRTFPARRLYHSANKSCFSSHVCRSLNPFINRSRWTYLALLQTKIDCPSASPLKHPQFSEAHKTQTEHTIYAESQTNCSWRLRSGSLVGESTVSKSFAVV